MVDIRRIYGKLCDVPNMYWNAIKVFTYPLECLFLCLLGDERDLRCERSGWFSANRAQITYKSPKRHKKDTQAGKWTLLLHFSTNSGHRIIFHTFFLCPPLTINLGYLWVTLRSVPWVVRLIAEREDLWHPGHSSDTIRTSEREEKPYAPIANKAFFSLKWWTRIR